MFEVFSHNVGVSVSLTNKTIIFSYKQTLIQTTQITPNYLLCNFNQYDVNSVLFTPASSKTSTSSKNTNIVQSSRKAYISKNAYSKISAVLILNWFFKKIKYQGKGLKIKKSTKHSTVIYNLGSSHISTMFFDINRSTLLRTRKNTFTALFLKDSNYINDKLVKVIRPYNIYTKRGLRVSRQVMHRRFGKVSQIAPKKR